MIGYKVFTHDLCSPFGGGPVWDGSLPYDLPAAVCAVGNVQMTAAHAVWFSGLWPNGKPCRMFLLVGLTSTNWEAVEEVPVELYLRELSDAFFGDLSEGMYQEQLAWYKALSRPSSDKSKIITGLNDALYARGLDWELKEFGSMRELIDAYKQCSFADSLRAWDKWYTDDAIEATAKWMVHSFNTGVDARINVDYIWSARDFCTKQVKTTMHAVRNALAVYYVSKEGWVDIQADKLTIGLREAFYNGLDIVAPVGSSTLGWICCNHL
jgi:hypothetical protein